MTKLEERYLRWRRTPASGAVVDLFRRFAREAMQRGRRFGMKALAERVRWEVSLERVADAESLETYQNSFRVNNIYISYIARELLKEMPELKNFVQIRKTKAERAPFPVEWMGRVNSPRRIPVRRASRFGVSDSMGS